MAEHKEGTKINSVKLTVNPEEIITFPGIIPAEEGCTFYTIRTFDSFAKDLGVLYYSKSAIKKENIITGESVPISLDGDLEEKFNDKFNLIDRLRGSFGPFDAAKDFVEDFINQRAKIKHKFVTNLSNAKKEYSSAQEEQKQIFNNVIIGLTDKYRKENEEISQNLEDFKIKLKYQMGDKLSKTQEAILNHLEAFNYGLFIGRNSACDFPINDQCVSSIQGILSEKDGKIVYKDLGLNIPLIYTFKEGKDGLEKYVESNGERTLIDKDIKNHQAAIIFLGEAVSLNPKNAKKTIGGYSKHYLCIARR